MKQRKLTTKQEKFCIALLALGNQSEAYRSVYNCTNSSDSTIYREASRLINNPYIATRFEELKQELHLQVFNNKITLLNKLEELIEETKASGKCSQTIKLIDLMCKMMNWYPQPEKPKPHINSMVILYDPKDVDKNNELTIRGHHGV